MPTGLPVASTPNSSTIVRDGVDGLIRSYDWPDQLAACVEKLIVDSSLRLQKGHNARQQVGADGINAYSRKIAHLMRRVAGIESDCAAGE